MPMHSLTRVICRSHVLRQIMSLINLYLQQLFNEEISLNKTNSSGWNLTVKPTFLFDGFAVVPFVYHKFLGGLCSCFPTYSFYLRSLFPILFEIVRYLELFAKNTHWMIFLFAHQIHRGYSNFWSEYDFYFIKWNKKMYISWVAKPWMKSTFFHFTWWNRSHSLQRNWFFFFIIYKIYWRR